MPLPRGLITCIAFMVYCLVLLPCGASARDHTVDLVSNDTAPTSLTAFFSVLEDPTLSLTLDQVESATYASRFQSAENTEEALNFGYAKSAFWLRLRVSNTGDAPIEKLMEIRYSGLSNVQFYQLTGDRTNVVSTGSVLPFSSRAYANRFFVFPIQAAPHSDQTIYLRIHSKGPTMVPAWLWTPAAFHAYERRDYTSQAWYFGIATAMVLFNALLFLALRDVAYLLYVMFVSCLSLTIASQNGLAKEFLWPDSSVWANMATSVGYCYSLLSLLLFMRHLLNTREAIKYSDRWLLPLVGIYFVSPIGFGLAMPTLIKPVVYLYAATSALVLGMGAWCVYKRQRTAYFFLAAFTVLCLAALATVARVLGWLPTNLLTVNALQFGSGLEMMLLAFALADRFNAIRKEKHLAQKELLATQQRMVESLQASERELEERVHQRTAEVNAKNAELTHAVSLLETVERIARHDLKTPLGSLVAAPALLRAGRTMQAHEEHVLCMMEAAANHALHMVNLSLDLYRMESGSYVPQFHSVDIGSVIGAVVQDLGVQARSKDISFLVTEPSAPVCARAEEALCYSIIANLTKNALEAAPLHSVVRLTLEGGPMVHLCIHNLGAVPEPLRESFFSKYSTVGKQGGTGLGTYSAALLAKAMAGTLSMETSDAAGTSLHLRLNVWAGPVAPAAATRLQDSDEIPDAANRRVLVVDDDEFNRMIAMERLSHTKAQVRSAVNGLDALEVVRSWRPDLIFMDIEMPVCDGHEALVGIRAFQTQAGQPRSLIVAFSGNDDAESRAMYISQGFDECLTKPASQRAMLNLLRRSVDQPTDAT